MSAHRTWVVLSFSSTHDVMLAEATLREYGLTVTTIPKPVSMGGAECGVALRLTPEVEARAVEILGLSGISTAGRGEILDR